MQQLSFSSIKMLDHQLHRITGKFGVPSFALLGNKVEVGIYSNIDSHAGTYGACNT